MGLFTDHASAGGRDTPQSAKAGAMAPVRSDSLATQSIKPASRDVTADDAPLNFDQLLMRCMGRIELAERLLASFERRFPLEVSQIEQCLETGDMQAFVRLTHQLKGASANVSAPALHSILKRIEEAGRVEQLEKIAAGLTDLRGAWDEFTQYKATTCVSTVPQPGQANNLTSAPGPSSEKPSCAY